MIRIFVIEDDERIIIPGLRNIFRPSRDQIDFIGSAPSVQEATDPAITMEFDLFFLDLYIRNEDPVENIKKLRTTYPSKPIIIYTTEDNAVWKRRAIRSGVKAYLTKKENKQTIKDTIIRVASGQSVFYGSRNDEDDKKCFLTIKDPESVITEKERQLVKLLSEGYKHKEIANMLKISLSGVDKLLNHLKKQFKASNNLNLVKLLAEQSII